MIQYIVCNRYIYIIQSGWSALIWASNNGHTDIVQLLLHTDNININLQTNVSQYIYIYAYIYIYIYAYIYIY